MGNVVIDAETLSVFIEDAFDVLGQWEKFCFDLKPTDGAEAFVVLMRCAHNLKGSAGLAGFDNLHHRIHVIEDYLVRLRDNYKKVVVPFDEVVTTLLETEREIRRWILKLRDDPNWDREISSEGIETSLKVLVGDLPSDVLTFDSEERTTLNQKTAKTEIIQNQGSNESSVVEKRKLEETLRVNASKVDRLIQLVGEISLNQSILARSASEGALDSRAARSTIDLNSKLVQDLQDATLDIRMIPVDGLFQKIERMVRDTAMKLAKHVKVERYGQDVTLDKLIVESMVEPLIHIARNAIDHGIEDTETRKSVGKAAAGSVKIYAENNSNGVSLIFEDDGKGIDGERVYKKAIEKGLIDPGQDLSPAAKLQLIFLPGLSTAEKVTELSGRGVGMDVVASEVQRLAGQIEISSVVGKGTRIQINLPTNLSIIDAIVMRSIEGLYAVPNRDIVEVIDLRDFPSSPVDGDHEQVFDLRGRIIPLADIESFLKINQDFKLMTHQEMPDPEVKVATRSEEDTHSAMGLQKPLPCLIVRHHEELLGLSVESVIGQQQVFVRPLLGHLRPITFYSGTTILSDGEPCIILNLSEMARRYFTSN
jgi:two-component system chemotaxis sensor kinase CheA